MIRREVLMTDQQKGLFYAIAGPVLWGFSGSIAQYLFSFERIPTQWLVGLRLILAGILLLIWCGIAMPKELFSILKKPRYIFQLLCFGLLGMLPAQYTYFMAIKYGNAPTATVLQFLGPLFIILYLSLRNLKMPRRIDMISIVLALIGTFLLVTHGHWNTLALSPLAVLWGVGSGLSQASYTLLPRELLKNFDARIVTGWSMLLGGIVFAPVAHLNQVPQLTVKAWLLIIFIIIGGTMFSYLFYLQSLNYLSATTTGMLSAFEPLTATILSVTLLSTHVGPAEIAGALLILGITFLQALPPKLFIGRRRV
ncbi:DMT family permease [Companilactobacillus nodensis DSM 19682 = JCM 14932 = NBRC 107160]|uniref:DMT family permease n=2 Tax=Companilactobacillus nodensis TaxID=460870 RepID=A0A0R1K6B7_9LACO|nr:DMT family permease [Companilactobacillus nodensis DSM 19682 = JCM 14932 = NBRC 107160]